MLNQWTESQNYLVKDSVIGPLLNSYGPCTLRPKTEYFLVLCDSIISQQISVKASEAIFSRFNQLYAGNPTPDLVSQSSVEQLRGAGVSAQKARYLLDLANKFADGTVDYRHLSNMDNEQIIKELCQVKGIGRWTAEMFLMFALNRADVLPVDDLGIRKAVQIQYRLPELASAEEIRAIAKAWHPYETVACWYLWRSLENVPLPT